MAELLTLVLGKLDDLIAAEVGRIFNAKKDLVKLQSELRAIEASVKAVDQLSYYMIDGGLEDWIQKLKKVAYDAEDIIDKYQLMVQREAQEIHKVPRILSPFLSLFNTHFVIPRQLANEIEIINEELAQIAKERQNYMIDCDGKAIGLSVSASDHHLLRGAGGSQRETGSDMIEKRILGRDTDKETLIGNLLRGSEESVSVVSIVGIGGLGKTTLAQMIFNDDQVKNHFEGSVWWVCVSERPNAAYLARKILIAITQTHVEAFQLSVSCGKLKEVLSEKKFLLVLDDVWDLSWWEQLKPTVLKGKLGSKILITTRKREVSDGMNASYLHEPNGFSIAESWELFLSNALREGETRGALVAVDDIAEKILQKCAGLPLVVQSVGKVMRTKERSPHIWRSILNSKIWNWTPSSSSSSDILPGLMLSYDDLNPMSKRCFVYCCTFPKDCEYTKYELRGHWIAHGFFRDTNEKDMEIVADECFSDLVSRGLIERKDTVFGTRFGMHDIIHDLALYIGKREHSHQDIHESTRHLTLTEDLHEHSISREANKLRTLFCRSEKYDFRQMTGFISQSMVSGNLSRLRVLDLRGENVRSLPESIGELSLLKCLNLRGTWITRLPSSIRKLQSLQTLILSDSSIEIVPKEIVQILGLRHLHLDQTRNLAFMAKGLGKLTGLGTFRKLVVCEDQENGCSIRELKFMNRLRGNLVIEHMERVTDKLDPREAKLHQKSDLVVLTFDYDFQVGQINVEANETERQESVLKELQIPPNLETLNVLSYMGRVFPVNWFLNTRNLTELSLHRCTYLQTLPAFPESLMKLCIDKCASLNSLPPRAPALKSVAIVYCDSLFELPLYLSLEHLYISRCQILEILWKLEGNMGSSSSDEATFILPKLKSAKIIDLPNLTALLTPGAVDFPNLEYLEIDNCSRLQCLTQGGAATFPKLEKLWITGCRELNWLTEGTQKELPKLKELWLQDLYYLSGLTRGGATNMPKLEKLEIRNCHLLKSLPDGLYDLRSLILSGLYELTSITGEGSTHCSLPKLEYLYLDKCQSLSSQELNRLVQQGLPQLQEMRLISLKQLSYLSQETACLPKLKFLYISSCHNLSSLPEGLEGCLGNGLTIRCCQHLDDRWPAN